MTMEMNTTFQLPNAAPIDPQEAHRAAFAACLADIDGLQLIPRANYDLRRSPPRGYVFAVREVGTNLLYVSWSGSTPIKAVMLRLQLANAHALELMTVKRRDNVHDARTIAEYITNGLTLMRVRPGAAWFDVPDDAGGPQKIERMFASIDALSA